MSWYETHILPRVLELACGIEALSPARQKAVSGTHGTVLEIGFGSGLNLPFYPPSVQRVLAVDPSESARKLGRKRIEAAHCPVELVSLDAAKIDAEDGSADCAVSTFTLCSIDDVTRALAEVRRILRPGGTFMFLEHGRAPDSTTLRWQERLNPVERFLCGGCNLDRDIADLVRSAGFDVRSLDAGYFPGLPRTHGYLYSGVAA